MNELPGNHWRARPILAIALRGLVLLAPLALAVGLAACVGTAMRNPSGFTERLGWWAFSLALCVLVLTACSRLARRLLPLAMLLKLSLVFPDRAPSRFRIALRSGNLRRLEAWAKLQSAEGFGPDAGQQAETALTLVAALNAHDRRTRGHSDRVRALTDLVASELGLPEADVQRLRWAAMLHDIGKLVVPSEILNKPGVPDDREWRVLQEHPAEGARLAQPLATWMGEWVQAIGQHHERFDGNGYPNGLSGEEIALGARIVSVADSFEVITAVRSYKKPMSVKAAREELVRCTGSDFDPRIVRAFLNVSLGRLYWVTGLAAVTGQVPILGLLPRLGAHAANSASTSLGSAGAVAAAAALSLGVVSIPVAGHGPSGRVRLSLQTRAAVSALPREDSENQPAADAYAAPTPTPRSPAGPGASTLLPGGVDELVDTAVGQLGPLLPAPELGATVQQAEARVDLAVATGADVESVPDVVDGLDP